MTTRQTIRQQDHDGTRGRYIKRIAYATRVAADEIPLQINQLGCRYLDRTEVPEAGRDSVDCAILLADAQNEISRCLDALLGTV
jgi:hypothetical protein